MSQSQAEGLFKSGVFIKTEAHRYFFYPVFSDKILIFNQVTDAGNHRVPERSRATVSCPLEKKKDVKVSQCSLDFNVHL